MEYLVIDGGGKKVSKKKAAEIIRRTDAFYERLIRVIIMNSIAPYIGCQE